MASSIFETALVSRGVNTVNRVVIGISIAVQAVRLEYIPHKRVRHGEPPGHGVIPAGAEKNEAGLGIILLAGDAHMAVWSQVPANMSPKTSQRYLITS